MKNHNSFGIYLAGILILLMFTVSIACAEDIEFAPTLGTTSPTSTITCGTIGTLETTPPTTPPATLGTTPPIPGTIGGNVIPLNPVISVIALSCIGLLIILKKRK